MEKKGGEARWKGNFKDQRRTSTQRHQPKAVSTLRQLHANNQKVNHKRHKEVGAEADISAKAKGRQANPDKITWRPDCTRQKIFLQQGFCGILVFYLRYQVHSSSSSWFHALIKLTIDVNVPRLRVSPREDQIIHLAPGLIGTQSFFSPFSSPAGSFSQTEVLKSAEKQSTGDETERDGES